MPLNFPLAAEDLSDFLKVQSVVWGVQRNDELSGSGDGRTWSAELAPPLWTAEVSLPPAYHFEAKRKAARIRSLEGARNAFFLIDPSSKYPALDPLGSTLGSSTVTVSAIASDRKSITLGGLPVSYQISAGDKGQVTYGSDPTRYWFFEFTEDRSGNGTVGIFPRVPLGVSTGATITLKKPACLMFIVPGSFNPGRADALITYDMSFQAMERRR